MKKIMAIKKCLLPLLLFINLVSCNNDESADKNKTGPADSPPTVAPYYLEVPAGWTTELIRFPIGFAPGIRYTGMEDLRFAKGWGDTTSDEHWCYAFAWWLDGKPVIDEGTLQQNLTEYYTGLVKGNTIERKIPEKKIIPTAVVIKTAGTMTGDIASYTGTVSMLDYLSKNPIVLNCTIHIKKCDVKDHTAVLFQISPKPFNHLVWEQLNRLNTNFTCGK